MVEAFINRIKHIILNHLEDEKFGVSELSLQLGLSRSQTLRKVNAATGKSVSQLIKEIRLAESIKLIRKGEYTASEIAFKVGFSSPSYFNKCFHDYFDITPGDYKTQNETAPFLDEFIQDSFKKKSTKKSNNVTTLILTLLIVASGLIFFLNFFSHIEVSKIKGPSIAVLAFTDLSPNQDKEWFAEGISEELLNLLVKIPELRVVSRTSSFSYKGKNKTIKKIGNELKVSHILEGSVRKFNDKLFIKAQLVNVDDGSLSWSETYERNIDELFQIQQEIAFEVIKKLKIVLLLNEVKISITNSDAYTNYLKAKSLHTLQNNESNSQAEYFINQSIELDSTYAPSWNLLSRIIYDSTINLNLKSKNEGLLLAKKAAHKALEIDTEFAPAYASLSKINLIQWDFKQANENLKKAMKLDHRNSFILYTAALNAEYSGRLNESISLFQQALKMDPFACHYYLDIANVYYFLDRLDDANLNMNKFNCIEDDSAIYHAYLSKILLAQGKKLEALSEAEKETNEFWKLYAKNFAVYALGRNQKADSLLLQFKNKYSKSSPSNLASLHAYRGEQEKAFKWLEVAFNQSDTDLIEVLNYPSFKNLYKDPRWSDFILKMDFPKDHWLVQ